MKLPPTSIVEDMSATVTATELLADLALLINGIELIIAHDGARSGLQACFR